MIGIVVDQVYGTKKVFRGGDQNMNFKRRDGRLEREMQAAREANRWQDCGHYDRRRSRSKRRRPRTGQPSRSTTRPL